MTRGDFEQLVEDGIAQIPPSFRPHLDDVAILVRRRPTSHQRRAARIGTRDILFALYEGTPRTNRQYLPYRLPDTMTLFQESFERVYGNDPERMRAEVAETVWHELAHALGMSERQVRAAERRRRNGR